MAGTNKDPHGVPPTEPLDLENPANRHENTDVDVWAITRFTIGLVLVCILSLSMLIGFFHYLESTTSGVPQGVEGHEPVVTDANQLPPAPQLEETPVADLARQRAAEEKLLTTYGWVNRQEGIVRLPIDRAMDLVVASGLPSNTAHASASTASAPSESGLGPIVQQPGGPLAAAAGVK